MGHRCGAGISGAGIYGAIYCPIGLWGRLGPHRFGLGFMGLGFMGSFGTPQIYGARIYGAVHCPIDWGWDLWGFNGPTDLWGRGLWGCVGPHRFMGPGFMGPFGTP